MNRSIAIASALAITFAGLSGCAASRAQQGGGKVVWTAPAQDKTYRSPEEASRAYETVQMLAGGREFRYAGNGRWEVLEGGVVVRAMVIGHQADVDWNQ